MTMCANNLRCNSDIRRVIMVNAKRHLITNHVTDPKHVTVPSMCLIRVLCNGRDAGACKSAFIKSHAPEVRSTFRFESRSLGYFYWIVVQRQRFVQNVVYVLQVPEKRRVMMRDEVTQSAVHEQRVSLEMNAVGVVEFKIGVVVFLYQMVGHIEDALRIVDAVGTLVLKFGVDLLDDYFDVFVDSVLLPDEKRLYFRVGAAIQVLARVDDRHGFWPKRFNTNRLVFQED